ncbi:MAG: polysaccharide biosynthesis protein, partial [Clostridia bacterium]|nr:polysaccharide biosynthesis protein [Clostridia bacterium]
MCRLRSVYLFLADILMTAFSFSFCYFISRQYKILDGAFYLKSLALLLIIFPIMLALFGIYKSLWRYARSKEFASCLAATVSAGILFFLASRLFIEASAPLYLYVFSTVCISFAVYTIRVVYQFYRDYIHYSKHKALADDFIERKRTLIIGGGEACRILISEIRNNPASSIIPVLVCDKDPAKQGKRIMDINIISDDAGYEAICKENNIEQIIIAIPSADNATRAKIVDKCSKTNCPVKIIPHLSDITNQNGLVHDIRDITMDELLGRDPVKLTNEQIYSVVEGKTIMVTGGGGSIGSELCRQIAKHKPKRLIIIDIYENNAYNIQQELIRKYGSSLELIVLIGTVRNKNWIHKTVGYYKPDIILHAAAHKHVPLMETSPAEAVKNNVFGTYNTAMAAGDAGVGKFILISTDKAVNPTNIMGATKRICEMIVHSMCSIYPNTHYSAVRFGNVLGSNGSVIPLFKQQIIEGGPVTVTHPDIIRYFMTIPEAAQLVLLSAAFGGNGEVFVLDMGSPVKIDDLARKMIWLSGLTPGKDIAIKY